MSEHISGEEYNYRVSSRGHKGIGKNINFPIWAILAVILFTIFGFIGGIQYQKSKASNNVSALSSGRFGGQGQFGRGNRVAGTVANVGSNSITITTRSGNTVTLNVTSSTQITNGGQTAQLTDIKTGDFVLASKDPSNTSNAVRIMDNPSFGGGGGISSPPSDQSQSSQSFSTE